MTPEPLGDVATTPAVLDPAAAAAPVAPGWSRLKLVFFRYALIHYFLYAFPGALGSLIQTTMGGLALAEVDLDKRPWRWLGPSIAWIDPSWEWLTTKMGSLGIAPYEVIHQRTGSGDTGANYAQLTFIVVVALVGTLIWTLLSRAKAYPRLGRWLHLLVRFDLAFTMFGYGFAKFYGGQFGTLSLTRMSQEIGDTWPMTMVGTFMQASKPYELFGGACEVLAGLLLFHRRTALLGACIAIVTMTNICALNWLYGVPVKQYSAHLLLYGVALLAPFCPQLAAVFLRNKPSQPVDLRVVRGGFAGGLLLVLGVLWVGGTLVVRHLQGMQPRPWMQGQERCALYGMWTVESMSLDGQELPPEDATRWRDFAVDRGTLAWARELSGTRHYFDFAWDAAKGAAIVRSRSMVGESASWTCECGAKTVKGDPPLLLRNEERGKPVDVERRSLVLKGKWNGRDLEVHAVEKLFRLQTGFRLRQELPDFW